MKPEIEEWYASKRLPVDRIIEIGLKRHSIQKKEAILQALEEEYDRRTGPTLETFKDITIAWDVWARARKIQSEGRMAEAIEKHSSDQARIKDLTDLLSNSTKDYAELNATFESKLKEEVQRAIDIIKAKYQRRLNFWFGAYVILVCACIGYVSWTMGVF